MPDPKPNPTYQSTKFNYNIAMYRRNYVTDITLQWTGIPVESYRLNDFN